MATRMLINGFPGLAGIEHEMDRLLNGVLAPAIRPRAAAPQVSVGEDADNLYVEAIVPGLNPKSLDVTLEEDILRLSGERPGAPEGAEVIRWYKKDRPEGKFIHRLRVPMTIQREKISAEYKDGILLVTLPKAEAVKPRQIEVKVS